MIRGANTKLNRKSDPYRTYASELRRGIRSMAKAGHKPDCKTKNTHPSNCCWKGDENGPRSVLARARWRAELTWIALGPVDQLVAHLEARDTVTLKMVYQCYGVIWAVSQTLIRFGMFSSGKKKDEILDTLGAMMEILEQQFNLGSAPVKGVDYASLSEGNNSGGTTTGDSLPTRGDAILSE